ncbi:IclR family transcriptional regulator [Cellulomonas composti]|uniref:IclR family transcriptional regulator n=1 Tax=Cellulomonas composti TaxID=266130 RepID=UPI0011BF7D8F|nr:IclR family transcriptional regulator [Cellulomonas composti]
MPDETAPETTAPDATAPHGAVDRLVGADRVLAVLVELARRPEGATLDDLARAVASPKSTVHRALTALTRAKLASRPATGQYALGDEFLRLAFAYHDARPEHVRIQPVLRALAERYGETAHYAVLDGDEVVYRAKVDPPSGAIRLTSTIGGRNPARSTAVGKLLLALALPDDGAARDWARAHPQPPRTPRTVVDDDAFVVDLARTRARGYAVDDEENELGIVCLAVPVSLGAVTGAVSVSALAYRTPLARLVADVPTIQLLVAGGA